MAKKMHLNTSVFERVEKADAQVLVVTKYFDKASTHDILDQIKNKKCVLGVGENRPKILAEKQLPREKVHFIGRIQSRKIPDIVKYTSVIHSLDNLKYAEKLNDCIMPSIPPKGGEELRMGVFLQINISEEPQKGGVMISDFSDFLKKVRLFPNLKILGISAMGSGAFDEKQKRTEFQELIQLRDEFLPGTKISAGTSRDYEIALEEGIEIVRVGQACFQ